MKKHVKKGDEVVVIAGAHKGKRGKILIVQAERDRVVVEGVAMVKKHQGKTQDSPEGAIVEREASIHISNVQHVDRHAASRAGAEA